MKYDIYQRLIGHVSKNEWADAKDLFESIIHEKVALRLEEEKRRTISAEDAVHGAKKDEPVYVTHGGEKKQLLQEPEEDDEKDEKDVEEGRTMRPRNTSLRKPGLRKEEDEKDTRTAKEREIAMKKAEDDEFRGRYKKEKVDESTPPGEESWVKANKARFKKEYGDKKGTEVLYGTAWKRHNKGK